jgi:hypothetical protein
MRDSMAERTRPVAVIVDRYTCSQYTLAAFHALGADVVQVQNRPELKPAIPDLTYLSTVVGSDPAQLAAGLAGYAPFAVVAGQEPDVPLADALSALMGLPSNGTALSSARRNKYEMIEALRRAGVPCADQFTSGDAEAVVTWAERAGRYPVVVKPLTSAATDGVAICPDAQHVRKAAEALLGTTNIFGDPNDEVLVQSYLDGTEYTVDMVSWAGRRYTCGVWRYHKRLVRTHNIYDHEVLQDPDDAAGPVPELVEYVDRALRALGIEYGPSHAEVMLTADGPRLVEVGARLCGNFDPRAHDRALGGNQADIAALAYRRPQEFLDRYAGRRYTRNRHAWTYLTPTELSGTVTRIDQAVVEEIRGLDTFAGLAFKIHEGGPIRPTTDLHSATMRVFLVGDSDEQVCADYLRVQQLKDRLCEVAGP